MFTATMCGCVVTDYCYKNIIEEKYDEAIIECSRQINGEVKVTHIEYPYNSRGNAYVAKGLFDLAIADFNKAIELKPNYYVAYNSSGRTYIHKGDLNKALADINRAIELNPNYAHAFNNRGIIYTDKGQLDQAIADYNKAIELDPKHYWAYRNRGRYYVRMGKLDMALTDFSKSIELNPLYDAAYSSRGDAYYRQGQYEQALLDFNRAVEINPKNNSAFINRGLLFESQSHYDQAVAEYKKAIDVNPKYEYAYLNLMIATWLSKTDPIEASNRLRQYVSSCSSTKWIRIVSKYYLGADAVSEQDVLQEARKGKNDREVNERLCEAYYYLAIKRLIAGNRSGAEEFFTKSIRRRSRCSFS
jgi:lipoprotein NlpI